MKKAGKRQPRVSRDSNTNKFNIFCCYSLAGNAKHVSVLEKNSSFIINEFSISFKTYIFYILHIRISLHVLEF